MSKYPFLFSHRTRTAGYIIFVPAVLFTLYRFAFGYKPEFLDIKIFAFYSSFVGSKYFTFMRNNISEEICAGFILLSLILIAFSKERDEKEEFWTIRFKDLFNAFYLNLIFIAFSIIFIYGLAFVKILILNMYSLLIIYIILTQNHFRKLQKFTGKIKQT